MLGVWGTWVVQEGHEAGRPAIGKICVMPLFAKTDIFHKTAVSAASVLRRQDRPGGGPDSERDQWQGLPIALF